LNVGQAAADLEVSFLSAARLDGELVFATLDCAAEDARGPFCNSGQKVRLKPS
jgi:hypothetical protein